MSENLEKHKIRLRTATIPEDCSSALEWYRDEEVVYFSEGPGIEPYNFEIVKAMYDHLSSIGELYIIEVFNNNKWLPIGDVTLAQDTIPIVIGNKKYRSKGIGKQAISLIIQRARELEWKELKVKQVFDYNERSHRLFKSLGFELAFQGIDNNGNKYKSYILKLTKR